MTIKEKIAALPDAIQHSPTNIVTTASVETADLKTLADSHTELLMTLRSLHYGTADFTDYKGCKCCLTIEEAEKL